MKHLLLLSCLLLGATGCVVETKMTEQDKLSRITTSIPLGSKAVKYLGNEWYIFELQGELFLYRQPFSSRSELDLVTHIGTQNKELRAELEAIEVK